jgi:hypothetical protein
MDNLIDFSLQNENEFRNISKLFDEMKVQYNLNNLKNCTIEILNCLEKKDGSVANFESLISTIKTFKDLHTDIVKMRSFPILNSIFEHYSHEIFEGANYKLNFSKLIFNMRDHFPFVSDQDLEALIPDIEERKKFTESEMLKFINVSCQTPVKITSYLIYFHKSLKKLTSFIENPLFISKLNGE